MANFKFNLLLIAASTLLRDIQGLTLTTSHQGFYCPNTTAVFICTAMQTIGLEWTAQGKDIGKFVPLNTTKIIHGGPYTLTLINVTSRDRFTDFISSLQVSVNGIENGTNVTCQASGMQRHSLIYKESIPSPPQNVTITSEDLGTENFSIAVSWDAVDDVEYVIYTNSSNSTQVVYTNTSNMATLEGKYNMVINVTLAAINCVGRSEVTTHIFVDRSANPTPTPGSDLSNPTSTASSTTFSSVVANFTKSLAYDTSSSVVPSGTTYTTPIATAPLPVGLIVGISAAIVGVAGTVVVTIIGLMIFKQISNVVRKKELGRNKRNRASNEMVTPVGISIDSCYDVVRLENIAKSSLNQYVPPTPFNEDKTQAFKVDQNGESSIHQKDDSCQQKTSQTHGPPAERPPPIYYEDLPPIKQKTPQRHRLDTLETHEFNLSSESPDTTPPPKLPRTPGPCETEQFSVEEKHPLDEKITIDQVIQQLGELIPQWEKLGRAADIQPSVLKEIADHFKDPKDCFVEVINQVFIPNQTMWADLIALCDEAGFEKMSNDLQEAYRTGVLPVKVEDKEVHPQSKAAPPIPPRGSKKETNDKDNATNPDTPGVPSPVVPEDDAPPLPPPLAPEDIPSSHSQLSGHRRLPPLPPNTERLPPARPPKAPKPSALTKL